MRHYDRGTGAFYAHGDVIRKVANDLDELAADKAVIDAGYAVNDVKRRASSLKTEE